MDLVAKWIWPEKMSGYEYNQQVIFRRDFTLEQPVKSAELAISADTVYRLKVNGQWLADGPARAYPEHYGYDKLDLAPLLRRGLNRIEVDVRFFGCGTFHQLPQRGGLLLQLDVDGKTLLTSDADWQAAIMPQWVASTPKISPQQGPYEIFDASRSAPPEWRNCAVIDPAPWQDLTERSIPMLTRREALCRCVLSVQAVKPARHTLAICPQRLKFPTDFSINRHNLIPLLLAFEFEASAKAEITLPTVNLSLLVNGKPANANGKFSVARGTNFVVASMTELCGHFSSVAITLPDEPSLRVGSLYCHIFDDLAVIKPDIPYLWANPEIQQLIAEYFQRCRVLPEIGDLADFRRRFPESCELDQSELLSYDAAQNALLSDPAPGQVQVDGLQNLIHPDDRDAVFYPLDGADIRFICDLGAQDVGYWNFMLNAPRGTIVDIAAAEYRNADGVIQPTGYWYLNSMRYICCEGFNRFTSYQRRSGRYLVVTLRNFSSPVRFRSLRLVESTYPVVQQCGFRCSDPLLDRIYEISARTLKLCMEDTFTDCPLYEQTFWVGDARSEALFAMASVGAYDLARHCLKLVGESEDHLPFIGCQIPSGWQAQIPAQGLMWVLAAEDYFRESGDAAFIAELWPRIAELLRRALALRSPKTGLMKTGDWNFLEWSDTKTEYPTMLYNSQLLIGALHSAEFLAGELGRDSEQEQLRRHRQEVTAAVNACWSERHLAYYNALDADDQPVEEFAVHTSILALLFDAMPPGAEAAVKANILTRRHDLCQCGSPFFTFYLHQALEKLDMPDESYQRIRGDYLPMLKEDATTVWESFPGAVLDRMEDNPFPTRSHCHAWSSIPLELFPRLLLGVRPLDVGGKKFAISPYPADLDWAGGDRMTPAGKITVNWQIDRQAEKMRITVRHPVGVECVFAANCQLKDWEIEFNCIESN